MTFKWPKNWSLKARASSAQKVAYYFKLFLSSILESLKGGGCQKLWKFPDFFGISQNVQFFKTLPKNSNFITTKVCYCIISRIFNVIFIEGAYLEKKIVFFWAYLKNFFRKVSKVGTSIEAKDMWPTLTSYWFQRNWMEQLDYSTNDFWCILLLWYMQLQ